MALDLKGRVTVLPGRAPGGLEQRVQPRIRLMRRMDKVNDRNRADIAIDTVGDVLENQLFDLAKPRDCPCVTRG